MSRIDEKLEQLGITLPPAPSPIGSYVPAVRTGNLLYLSGLGPGLRDDGSAWAGKVGADYTMEEGNEAARSTGISIIARMKGHLGDLDKVKAAVAKTGVELEKILITHGHIDHCGEAGVLAKELGTLDAMSGGRVDLGIGVGWLREEFDALGIPWEHRAARTDEYVAAMRTLWSGDKVSFDTEPDNRGKGPKAVNIQMA